MLHVFIQNFTYLTQFLVTVIMLAYPSDGNKISHIDNFNSCLRLSLKSGQDEINSVEAHDSYKIKKLSYTSAALADGTIALYYHQTADDCQERQPQNSPEETAKQVPVARRICPKFTTVQLMLELRKDSKPCTGNTIGLSTVTIEPISSSNKTVPRKKRTNFATRRCKGRKTGIRSTVSGVEAVNACMWKAPACQSEHTGFVSEMKHGADLIPRPRGRAPKGMTWNKIVGQWVPTDGVEALGMPHMRNFPITIDNANETDAKEYKCMQDTLDRKSDEKNLIISAKSVPLTRKWKHKCPTTGCNGKGHVNRRFTSHRTKFCCPLMRERSDMSLKNLKGSSSSQVKSCTTFKARRIVTSPVVTEKKSKKFQNDTNHTENSCMTKMRFNFATEKSAMVLPESEMMRCLFNPIHEKIPCTSENASIHSAVKALYTDHLFEGNSTNTVLSLFEAFPENPFSNSTKEMEELFLNSNEDNIPDFGSMEKADQAVGDVLDDSEWIKVLGSNFPTLPINAEEQSALLKQAQTGFDTSADSMDVTTATELLELLSTEEGENKSKST